MQRCANYAEKDEEKVDDNEKLPYFVNGIMDTLKKKGARWPFNLWVQKSTVKKNPNAFYEGKEKNKCLHVMREWTFSRN